MAALHIRSLPRTDCHTQGPATAIPVLGRNVGSPYKSTHAHPASRLQKVEPFNSRSAKRAIACQSVAVQQQTAVTQHTSQSGSQFWGTAKGSPEPLGPSKTAQGINFALYSKNAKSVRLCLYDAQAQLKDEVPTTRTGDVFHVELLGLPGSGVSYAFKVAGEGGWETGHRWQPDRPLLDPYAPLVTGRRRWAVRDEVEKFETKAGSVFLGTYDFDSAPFDWGADGSRTPKPLKDLVIYEVPVRGFTADPGSGLPDEKRGTYQGMIEKIPYLTSLGINAVELLPVFEYDELEFQRSPNPRDHMVNCWGYSHINFFSPMTRLSSQTGATKAAREFKQLVKSLHEAGIEVLLDVVYNHTAESDDRDPYMLTLRGIDNTTYYMHDLSKPVQLLNWSGCGNTVNANHPVVTKLILDSLVHWVTEYHVDGFRFDLAACLCRDQLGNPIPVPPLIEQMTKHPILSKVKLIAEPWDLGMYQVGRFPNWDIWSEWNGMYRDDVRKFIKGDAGMKKAFATRLAGSADLYNVNQRRPYHSINFIIAHDGFSLYDLVAYNSKHNDANGENNNDGSNDNFSWNCGVEGETDDAGVKHLRQRQMRNMMLALMLSQGTPMLVMGDEVALTHSGNNNWYGHDSAMGRLQWKEQEQPERAGFLRFCSELIHFRHNHPALGRETFLGPSDITWHEGDWHNDESRFLAFTLHSSAGDIYAAFNAHTFSVEVPLPPAPAGRKWARVVDTNLPSPKDFTPGGNSGVEAKYSVQGFSAIMLIAK